MSQLTRGIIAISIEKEIPSNILDAQARRLAAVIWLQFPYVVLRDERSPFPFSSGFHHGNLFFHWMVEIVWRTWLEEYRFAACAMCSPRIRLHHVSSTVAALEIVAL